MKTSKLVVIVTALCGLAAVSLSAQRPDGGRDGRPDGNRRPVPPFMVALDLDRDGVLSADEIRQAPESLLKLDKNGDGQLTLDEIRPTPQRNRAGTDDDRPRRNPRENRDSSDREQVRERPDARDSRPRN